MIWGYPYCWKHPFVDSYALFQAKNRYTQKESPNFQGVFIFLNYTNTHPTLPPLQKKSFIHGSPNSGPQHSRNLPKGYWPWFQRKKKDHKNKGFAWGHLGNSTKYHTCIYIYILYNIYIIYIYIIHSSEFNPSKLGYSHHDFNTGKIATAIPSMPSMAFRRRRHPPWGLRGPGSFSTAESWDAGDHLKFIRLFLGLRI